MRIIHPKVLKKERLVNGFTQSGLAKKAGVSQSVIAKIESGRIDPTFAIMEKISFALHGSKKVAKDVMVSQILYSTGNMKKDILLMKEKNVSQLVAGVGVIVSEKSLILGKSSEEVPCVPPDFSVEILRTILVHVPVVLVILNGKVIGIVSRSDVL